jgi:hypothetical protein
VRAEKVTPDVEAAVMGFVVTRLVSVRIAAYLRELMLRPQDRGVEAALRKAIGQTPHGRVRAEATSREFVKDVQIQAVKVREAALARARGEMEEAQNVPPSSSATGGGRSGRLSQIARALRSWHNTHPGSLPPHTVTVEGMSRGEFAYIVRFASPKGSDPTAVNIAKDGKGLTLEWVMTSKGSNTWVAKATAQPLRGLPDSVVTALQYENMPPGTPQRVEKGDLVLAVNGILVCDLQPDELSFVLATESFPRVYWMLRSEKTRATLAVTGKAKGPQRNNSSGQTSKNLVVVRKSTPKRGKPKGEPAKKRQRK